MEKRARILLFTGPGKGKTTAALGTLLRAVGRGGNVLLAQFCKNSPSSELDALAGIPSVTILRGGLGIPPPPTSPNHAEHARAARELFARVEADAEKYTLVILDEVCGAVAKELVPEARVLAFLRALRPDQSVILTGRNATPAFIAAADTVTEMTCLKHCFNRGTAAQEGIEF